jgi:hypothetical protein
MGEPVAAFTHPRKSTKSTSEEEERKAEDRESLKEEHKTISKSNLPVSQRLEARSASLVNSASQHIHTAKAKLKKKSCSE